MISPRSKIVAEIGAAINRTGWSETARRSGLDRPGLHRNFGRKSVEPSLATIERVLPALGLELTLTQVKP